jgi:hypothetical protein
MAFKSFGGTRGKGNVNFRIDARELAKIERWMRALKKSGIKALKNELRDIARDIVFLAVENAPEDTGSLKSTGRVIPPRNTATVTRFEYIAIFGGAQGVEKFVNYALIVEERHPTQSKYLARAIAQVLPTMEMRVRKAIQGKLRKGFTSGL